MQRLLAVVGAAGVLLLTAFCAFGFLASFEPGVDRFFLWRLGFSLGFVATLWLAIWLLVRGWKSTRVLPP